MASSSADQTIKIWDKKTCLCNSTLTGHTNAVTSLYQLEDGMIASASWDYTVKIWDLKTGQCVTTLKGHTDSVRSLIQLDDGKIASASYQAIIIWG